MFKEFVRLDDMIKKQVKNMKKKQQWEKKENWHEYVATPCVWHNLAPREALAIIEVFGCFADLGIKPSSLLEKIPKGNHSYRIYEKWKKQHNNEATGIYSSNSKCIKCGKSEAAAQYLPDSEMISRNCNNCGYGWEEIPMDQIENQDKKEIK